MSKADLRVETYGTIDELNSFVALLLDAIEDPDDYRYIMRLNLNLFNIGVYIASGNEDDAPLEIELAELNALEAAIDKIDAELPPIRHFVVPGRCVGNALANVCRTVCRRAERLICRLNQESAVNPRAMQFINRASDYFFVLGRKQHFIHNVEETAW